MQILVRTIQTLTSTVEANISYEILTSIFLMGVIYIVVHFKKLGKLTGVAIGGIIALDILFFGLVSGASMNPIRSLAPAVISGVTTHGDLMDLALFDYAIHRNNHSCSHLQGTLRTHEKHQHALERY